MMIYFLYVLLFLFVWWSGGVFNICMIQAYSSPRTDFNDYQRSSTLGLCFGAGLIFTLIIVGWFVIKFPIKFGTRWGRELGRRINPDNDD